MSVSLRMCVSACVHVGGWVSAVRNGVYTYHYLRPTSGSVRLLRWIETKQKGTKKRKEKSHLKSIFLSCYFRAWALGIFLGLVGLGPPHSLGWFWTARRGLRLPPRWCIAKCKRRQPSCGGPSLRKKMKKKKKKEKKAGKQRGWETSTRRSGLVHTCVGVFFFLLANVASRRWVLASSARKRQGGENSPLLFVCIQETGVFIYLLVVPIIGHSLLIIIENHVQGHDFTGIRK